MDTTKRSSEHNLFLQSRTGRRRFLSWAVCALLAAACVFAAANFYFSEIQAKVNTRIRTEMADVTNQYAAAVQTELRAKGNFMKGIAKQLSDTEEDIRQELSQLETMKDLYHFTQVGYVTPDGTAFNADGKRWNVGEDPFWQTVCEGNVVFSDVMLNTEYSGDQEVNVATAPVFHRDSGEIQGYVFVTYSADYIRELLAVKSFDGQGKSYIMLPDGDVLTGPEGIGQNGNMFEILASDEEGQKESLERIRNDFARGSSGYGTYQLNGELKHMYYMPLPVMDGEVELYLATTVPIDVMNSRALPIIDIARRLAAMVVLSVLVFLGVAVLSYGLYSRALLNFAYTDPLTEGDNYNAFRMKMKKRKSAGYIVSADLASFKIINNICGVERADRLLRTIWEVLQNGLKSGELGGHISGDRYVLFLTDCDLEQVIRRIEAWAEEIRGLSELLDTPKLTPKFGICPVADGDWAEDCYGKANMAKKEIEHRRDVFYGVYDEELHEVLARNKWMEDAFEEALENGEFEPWYQPKYGAEAGRLSGAEVLVRWRRPDGRLYMPGSFIELFEQNGNISALDEAMFRQVCENQKRWLEEGRAVVPVSINVSRSSLHSPGMIRRYADIVSRTAVDPRLVPLEITESAMVDNEVVEEAVRRFREAGFHLQIDDFGRGYSSLSTLALQCFDTLKMDKSLVDQIGDPAGEALLSHVIDLAHGLGMTVTAEGVERKEQTDVLKELHCDDLQGYFYSKPQPVKDFEALLPVRGN